MPEEEIKAGGEGGEEGKKKSGLLKLIIIGVGALLILGGGGFAAYKFFFAKPETPAAEGQATAGHGPEKKEEKKEEKKKDGGHGAEKGEKPFAMEPFIVNLADPGGKRYLKLTLSLDIKDEALKKALEARMPQIRDSILLLLSSKTFADISPVAGKLKLRNEVLKIINNTLGSSGQVHAIYFGEFVIQ